VLLAKNKGSGAESGKSSRRPIFISCKACQKELIFEKNETLFQSKIAIKTESVFANC